MNIQDILSQHITSYPDTIQFAKDRKYEEAWIIRRKGSHPSTEEINAYVSDAYKTLIVEYMWNSEESDKVFILTIFNDADNDLVKGKEFIEKTLELFDSYKNFSTFITIYDQNVIGKQYLLRHPIEEINIGIFNHWLSVCPESLYLPKEIYSRDLIADKLLTRPDILSTNFNFQSLLFRINMSGDYNGPYYGFKTPISIKEGDTWNVDTKKIIFWIETFLDKVTT